MIYWLIYPENFAYHGVALWRILKDLVPVMLLGTLVSLLSELGEEIGWRGFMVPALYQRLGINKMLIISSLFWCCWHIPLLIGGGYMAGTSLWYQIPAFWLAPFIMPLSTPSVRYTIGIRFSTPFPWIYGQIYTVFYGFPFPLGYGSTPINAIKREFHKKNHPFKAQKRRAYQIQPGAFLIFRS